jgi:hypothetical protein
LNGLFFTNLSPLKIILNIGVYLLYYIGYESIFFMIVDYDSPYET